MYMYIASKCLSSFVSFYQFHQNRYQISLSLTFIAEGKGWLDECPKNRKEHEQLNMLHTPHTQPQILKKTCHSLHDKPAQLHYHRYNDYGPSKEAEKL